MMPYRTILMLGLSKHEGAADAYSSRKARRIESVIGATK